MTKRHENCVSNKVITIGYSQYVSLVSRSMVSCFNLLFFFPMFLRYPLSFSLSLSNGQSLSSPRNVFSVSNNSPGVERSLSPLASHLARVPSQCEPKRIDRSPTEFLFRKRFEWKNEELSLSSLYLTRCNGGKI